MSCPITFDEKTGYRFNSEVMKKTEIQASNFYKQLDQAIDTSSSKIK
ncbi:hypothetical protein IJM86_02005 [bacterium]|nr:hypothetical protein [bacterium]